MDFIRPARAEDASRIAEMIVINYRENFYRFFRDDRFYYGELNVIDVAGEYCEGSQALSETYVYDNGVVRGVVRVRDCEVEKLYVEPRFQGQGIGSQLLCYAGDVLGADRLWVLEYNERGIAFYQRHGYVLTGERMTEDGWIPLLRMERRK